MTGSTLLCCWRRSTEMSVIDELFYSEIMRVMNVTAVDKE